MESTRFFLEQRSRRGNECLCHSFLSCDLFNQVLSTASVSCRGVRRGVHSEEDSFRCDKRTGGEDLGGVAQTMKFSLSLPWMTHHLRVSCRSVSAATYIGGGYLPSLLEPRQNSRHCRTDHHARGFGFSTQSCSSVGTATCTES